jgi:hypothetical protein
LIAPHSAAASASGINSNDTALSELEEQLQSLELLRSAVVAAAVSSDTKDLWLSLLLNYGAAEVLSSRSDEQLPPLKASEQRAIGEAVLSAQLHVVDHINSIAPGSVRTCMLERWKRCVLESCSVKLAAAAVDTTAAVGAAADTTAAGSAAASAAAATARAEQADAEHAVQQQLRHIVTSSQVAQRIEDCWYVRLLTYARL